MLAGGIAVVLVVVALVLIFNGDDRSAPTAPSTTASSADASGGGGATKATLPLGQTSQAAVAQLTGLVFPAGTADFLTAKLADGTQLDVTFTIPKSDEAAFVSASGLPALKAKERVVSHSSPLWKLNPEGQISGAADTRGSVARAVELVTEGDRLRARVVISPAA